GLDAVLAADRAEGFDLARPPLLRAALIRDGNRHRLLLTLHHIVADGWSLAVLHRELLAAHRGEHLPEPFDPHPYLTWLAGRDLGSAREAWRKALSGLPGPTRLTDALPAAAGDRSSVRQDHLGVRLPGELTARARAHGLTPSTVVHGLWALLLGGLTG